MYTPGIVPLFLAARGGHLELVRGLLKNKAAVNFQGAQQNIGGCGLVGSYSTCW